MHVKNFKVATKRKEMQPRVSQASGVRDRNGSCKYNRRQEKRKKDTKRSLVEISFKILVTIVSVNGLSPPIKTHKSTQF